MSYIDIESNTSIKRYIKIYQDTFDLFIKLGLSGQARWVVVCIASQLEINSNKSKITYRRLQEISGFGTPTLNKALDELGLRITKGETTAKNHFPQIVSVEGVKKRIYTLQVAFNGLVEKASVGFNRVTRGVAKNVTTGVTKETPSKDIIYNTCKNTSTDISQVKLQTMKKRSGSFFELFKKPKYQLAERLVSLLTATGRREIQNPSGYAFGVYRQAEELNNWEKIELEIQELEKEFEKKQEKKLKETEIKIQETALKNDARALTDKVGDFMKIFKSLGQSIQEKLRDSAEKEILKENPNNPYATHPMMLNPAMAKIYYSSPEYENAV